MESPRKPIVLPRSFDLPSWWNVWTFHMFLFIPSRKVQDDLPCMCPRSLTKIWATSVMGDHQVAMEKFTWMNWATSILGNLNIYNYILYMIHIHYPYTYIDIRTHVYITIIRTHVYIIIYTVYTLIYINMHYTFFNFPDLWCKMITVLWFAGALFLKANRTLYILYTKGSEHGSLVMWRSLTKPSSVGVFGMNSPVM